jgi:hypothetical protein
MMIVRALHWKLCCFVDAIVVVVHVFALNVILVLHDESSDALPMPGCCQP